MLVIAPQMQLDAAMCAARQSPKKRTRILANNTASTNITIRPLLDSKGYTSYLVQGWKEDTKWQRKQFKSRSDAERFAAIKRVEMENQGRAQRMILCALTDDQAAEATRVLERLGQAYTLTEAVDYFLRHHRPPEFTIDMKDAIVLYLADRELDGIRPRSIKAIKSVLDQFSTQAENPLVNEVSVAMVEKFLRSLRAKNQTDRASLKTWNNYRNDLNGFFLWAIAPDAASNRPFTFENPVLATRKFKARQVREQQSPTPATTDPARTRRIFLTLMRWRRGALVKYYALLYFAGIRPEELKRMASREKELINLKTRTITIPANVSKTRHERQIKITDNLAVWLKSSSSPIIPPNFDRLAKKVRVHFKLTHDEARHSFISYHVALHRSVGDAALQAGNSESIVKRHYLNTHTEEEGGAFFGITPDLNAIRAGLI